MRTPTETRYLLALQAYLKPSVATFQASRTKVEDELIAATKALARE
jgi:hypothetical protein